MNLQIWFDEMIAAARKKGMNDAAIARAAGMRHSSFVQLRTRIKNGGDVFTSTLMRISDGIEGYEK